MKSRRAFTMIELVVVMIITGILAAIALPSYIYYMQQGEATATEHNLLALYNAQKIYLLYNGTYYNSATNPDSDTTIATNLKIPGFSDNYFNYYCTGTAASYSCTATNIANSNFSLTLTNGPIVLPGGKNCSTPSGSSCNPSCSSTNSNLCPTS